MIINKKIKFYLFASSLFSLFADSEFSNINFEISDGVIIPNFFYPIHWTDSLYSGVGYTAFTNIQIKDIPNYQNGRNSSSTENKTFQFNILTKKYNFNDFDFSIGLETNLIDIKKREFGFTKNNSLSTIFENSVDIDVIQTGAYLNLSNKSNGKFLWRVSGDIYPSNKIDFEQTTAIDNYNANYKGSASADISYSALLELMFKTDKFLSFGFEAGYNLLALEYKLQQFNNINKTFSVQLFQGETESSYWLIKTILDFKLMGEMNPSIGFGKKRTIERDLTNNKHEIINETIWRIGAEKRF